jgi:hypothetical protein
VHEIYMLAVLFNDSRRQAAAPSRDQRLRDEQAFYDRHSGDHWPGFPMLARVGTAVPVAVVTIGLVLGLTRLLFH